MRILYDYQAFTMQTHGGASKCFAELISHLPKTTYYEIGILESDNIHLMDKNLVDNLRNCSKTAEKFLSSKPFKGQHKLFKLVNDLCPFYPSPIHINKKHSIECLCNGKFDVFHPTFYDDYFLKYIGIKPFILTIHDMIWELFPSYYNPKDYQITQKKRLAEKASHIIAVSEKTKCDIIDILKIPEKKISVVYHGAPSSIDMNTYIPIIDGPYLLFVGRRARYKNFSLMIKHSKPILDKYPNIKIVCTGNDFTKEEFQLFDELKIKDRIIHIFANGSELSSLYKNALAFIFPSQYEGFGLPILEAYSLGCPVLLNNKSCFPEIAGDSAMFFELSEQVSTYESILDKVLSFTPQERNVLIEKQYERLKCFSWSKAAFQLNCIYESVR